MLDCLTHDIMYHDVTGCIMLRYVTLRRRDNTFSWYCTVPCTAVCMAVHRTLRCLIRDSTVCITSHRNAVYLKVHHTTLTRSLIYTFIARSTTLNYTLHHAWHCTLHYTLHCPLHCTMRFLLQYTLHCAPQSLYSTHCKLHGTISCVRHVCTVLHHKWPMTVFVTAHCVAPPDTTFRHVTLRYNTLYYATHTHYAAPFHTALPCITLHCCIPLQRMSQKVAKDRARHLRTLVRLVWLQPRLHSLDAW